MIRKLFEFILSTLSPKVSIQLRYYYKFHKFVNFRNPLTFTEKIQWLKLYNRNPRYTTMVDKYEVKKYVADIIGEEYIIPTLGIWDCPEDIEWEKLPEKFVLKTTHAGGSTGVIICKDIKSFDKAEAVKKLRKSLKIDSYSISKEWPYKNVRRRIIAEKLLESSPSDHNLPDYKFYCFNGKPKYCQVIRDRRNNETIDFYDMEWNHQDFVGLNSVASNGIEPVERPKELEGMIDICKQLSKEIPFVRVDLYNVKDKVFFGELTFYPASGMGEFRPEQWDNKLGELLTLPTIKASEAILSVVGGGKYLITNNIANKISSTNIPNDYKFFCFGGKVRFFKVDFGRFTEHHANYFSPEGRLLELEETAFCRLPEFDVELPENLKDMIAIAEILSKGEPFLRVDLYNINGKIYFGELTFYPASGMGTLSPEEYDRILGDMLQLPKK